MAFFFVAGLAAGGGKSSDSENRINSAISAIYNVIVTVNNNCATSAINTQKIVIEGGNCSIDFSNVDLSQNIAYRVECLDTNNIDNNLSQEVMETINQQAEALSSAFQGSASATNIASTLTNLSQQITETFNNTCASDLNNTRELIITCQSQEDPSTIGLINFSNANLSQNISGTTSCVFGNSAVNKVVQDLKLQLGQTARAAKKGDTGTTLFIIIAVIIVIIVVIIIVVYSNSSSDSDSDTVVTTNGENTTN
jgi:hypothetical protein